MQSAIVYNLLACLSLLWLKVQESKDQIRERGRKNILKKVAQH